jgi:hypothetical protein
MSVRNHLLEQIAGCLAASFACAKSVATSCADDGSATVQNAPDGIPRYIEFYLILAGWQLRSLVKNILCAARYVTDTYYAARKIPMSPKLW